MGKLLEFSLRGLSSLPSCFYAASQKTFFGHIFSRRQSRLTDKCEIWIAFATTAFHFKKSWDNSFDGGASRALESALTTITLCFSEATTLLRRDGSSAKAAAFVVNSIVYLWQCCLFKGWLSHNSTKDQGPRTEQSPVLSALRLLRM